MVKKLAICTYLYPNRGELSITDKFFNTHGCTLFRGFTVLISDLLLFVFQFHIRLPSYGFGTRCILQRLKCPLNLSSEQRKIYPNFKKKSNTKVIWSKNFGLLGIKSLHGRPNSPSWYTDSWLYTAPPRVEHHCQLPSLLVHWSYRERTTHAIL